VTYAAAFTHALTADYSGYTGATVYSASSSPTLIETVGGWTPPPSPPPNPPSPQGYWLVGSDGGVFAFGAAQFYGSTGSMVLQRPVVGITPTHHHAGYWLAASDGGIFSYGDAAFFGSIPGLGLHPAGSGLPQSLNAPIVGMVPSSSGNGYFMVGSDGGVFAFGDATYEGSCPGIGGCAGSAVAVVPDASGKGYWLFTNNGNVYAFGDAPYLGAPGAQTSPIVSAVRTASGDGYWILDADGGVFAYGDAMNDGSPGLASGPEAAILAASSGNGYWVAASDGAVSNFGDAAPHGSMTGTKLNGSIVAGAGF
jgi:hypothetical protein